MGQRRGIPKLREIGRHHRPSDEAATGRENVVLHSVRHDAVFRTHRCAIRYRSRAEEPFVHFPPPIRLSFARVERKGSNWDTRVRKSKNRAVVAWRKNTCRWQSLPVGCQYPEGALASKRARLPRAPETDPGGLQSQPSRSCKRPIDVAAGHGGAGDVATDVLIECGAPGREAESEPVVDHGEPATG
jgi:hypothetical protein